MQDERILADPEPGIVILALKPGTVVAAFRAFTKPENVIPVTGWMTEVVKTELEKNNFSGPIPHSYVHTITEKN